jgi:hypothetical protein
MNPMETDLKECIVFEIVIDIASKVFQSMITLPIRYGECNKIYCSFQNVHWYNFQVKLM